MTPTSWLANKWLTEAKAQDELESEPVFGGPQRVTLGQFLAEYAFQFSIAKQSYKTEIDRINHYVTTLGLPRLIVRVDANGKRTLERATEPVGLPTAFRSHLDRRMSLRKEILGRLARAASTADPCPLHAIRLAELSC